MSIFRDTQKKVRVLKKNQIRCGLCLLLLTAFLSGCGTKPVGGEAVQPTLKPGPLIPTASTVTEPTVTVTEPIAETEPPPSLEPVTRLTAIKWRTVPQLLELGQGQVLSCRNYYEEGKGIINFLEVLDVYEDTVLARAQNSTPMDLVQQSFQDGSFILRDSQEHSFRVYDRTLKMTEQFSAPNVEGYFSQDRKNYYFVDNNVLYRMDVATGNYARMVLEYDLRFDSLTGIHPDRNIVTAKFHRSFYDESWGVCAIDCSTGKLLLLNESASHLWLEGDAFYAAVTNEKVYGSDICYGSLSGGTLQKVSTSALGNDMASYTMLSGSGILMHRTVDENNLSTTVYDLSQDSISCPLARYGYLTSTLGCIYLRQEQLIVGVYPDGYDFSPVVIDPKVLSYEKSLSVNKEYWPALVDRTAIQQYQDEVRGPELPDSLSSLRQRADVLEEEYGVRILIENQALAFCSRYAAVQKDTALISNALGVLEQSLALYPKGFFRQFQNGIGEGGLYFCLTGSVQGSLNPVGKTVKNKNRYELLLDIGAENLDMTIHHELWHSIEMKLSTDSFDPSRWIATNPQGFLYYGNYDNGYKNLTQWTYAQSGSHCYFVDAYARINPREDRARLMEYVMATDGADLMRAPALRQKLEIMCQVIREQFDTAGWETPYWERYL